MSIKLGGGKMKKAHVITGTPWHVETLHKKEDDPKRNKNWCAYYFKEQNYCLKNHVFCMGSAHCKDYKVVLKKEETIDEIREVHVEAFEGIKQIPIDLIEIADYFAEPKKSKVEKMIQYFKEHGEFDKPILVSCLCGKYKLEDQYLRYYVAKKLGLTFIAARMNTKENKFENKVETVGKKIKHDVYGEGYVKEVLGKYATVVFESGQEIKLDMDICVKRHVVSLVKP